MAYTFNGTSQYLVYGGVAQSTWPMTMACWAFNTAGDNTQRTAISIGNTTSDTPLNRLYSVNTAGLVTANSQVRNGAILGSATSAGTVAASTWYHMGASIASDGDAIVYLNGTGTAGLSITTTVPAFDNTTIGVLRRTSDTLFWAGQLAEVGIWNVILTAADFLALARGMAPPLVRPDELVAYWPIVRELHAPVGGFTMTNTASATVSAHPRIIYPRRLNRNPFAAAAAAGGFFSRWYYDLPAGVRTGG